MLIIESLSTFPLPTSPPSYTNFYLNLIPTVLSLWLVSLSWSIIIVLKLEKNLFNWIQKS